MLYGLYPYVVEQMDLLLGSCSCAGISVWRDGSRWRAEFHVVSEHRVQSVVVAVVRDCAEWERRLVDNVVPVLACLDGRNRLKTISVGSDSLVCKAVRATVSPINLFVAGMVNRATVFREVQRQFRTELAGLDPLSVLQYLRVRLMSVSQERFLDRLPHLRQITNCKEVVTVFF